MPYKSQAQRGKFHILEKEGEISPSVVKEFDQASKGMKLPEHAPKMAGGGMYAGGGELDFADWLKQKHGVDLTAPARSPASDDDAATTQPTEDPDVTYSADLPDTSRAPASTPGGNAVDLRGQLEDYLAKQKTGGDAMQKLADMYDEQVKEAGNRPNYSGLNAIVDSKYGTKLGQAYANQAPLTPMQQLEKEMSAQGEVSKNEQPVAQELLKEYGSDNNAASRAMANYYKQATQNMRNEQNLDKQEDEMGKAMNPMTSVYGTGGANLGQRLARARSVMALVQQHPNYDLDPREQKDMALGMASLITNQSRVPYELVQSLVPNTFQGNVAKWSEWMMNHPESAEAQAFVKRMVQTVQREQQTASQQIAAIQQQQAQRFNHLAVARPDRYRAHLSAGQSYLNMPTLDQVTTSGKASVRPVGAVSPTGYQKGADGKWHKVK